MKKLLLLLAAMLAFTISALAQGTTSSQTTTGPGSTTETTTTTKTTTKGKKAKSATAGETGAAASTSGTAAAGEKSATGKSAAGTTLTGCLAKGPEGNGYVLTNGRYKSGVAVNSDQDLSAHAGHTVKLTGSWEKPTAGAAGGAGPKGKQIRTFTATDVKHVSDTCGAGGAKSAKAGAGETTGASATAGHKHTTKKSTSTSETTTTAAPK